MRRRGPLLFVSAFVTLVGCNTILENEPGRLDRGGNASNGDRAGGGGGTSQDDDGRSAERVSGEGTDGTETTRDGGAEASEDGGGEGCASGAKACGELCVSPDDPYFGCGDPSCARCDLPNANATCAASACAIESCVAGFADCNLDPRDGCETNVESAASCGGCGLACPVYENVAMACVAGACTGTCLPGFADCNEKPEDGCERDLMNDKRHCGACGTRCVIGRCEAGTCVWP